MIIINIIKYINIIIIILKLILLILKRQKKTSKCRGNATERAVNARGVSSFLLSTTQLKNNGTGLFLYDIKK